MSTVTIEERRARALAELPPYREPGVGTRLVRWLRAHLIQFLAAFALIRPVAPGS